MDRLWVSIDQYCERTGPEFWSEPVNALTNLAFVAAGIWGLREVRRREAGGFAAFLSWMVILVGIGSGLFHTFATGLTMWADVLPIAIFTLAYAMFNLRRFLRLSWPVAIVGFLAYFALVGGLTAAVPQWLREASNGSTGYIAPMLGLMVFGILALRRGSPAGWYNLAAAVIFSVAVLFRTVDPVVCESFPLGTHFLWHTLNGLLLAVLLAAAARYGRPVTTR